MKTINRKPVREEQIEAWEAAEAGYDMEVLRECGRRPRNEEGQVPSSGVAVCAFGSV